MYLSHDRYKAFLRRSLPLVIIRYMMKWNWLNSGLLTLLVSLTQIAPVHAEDPPAPPAETPQTAEEGGIAPDLAQQAADAEQPRVEPDPAALQLADLAKATSPETEVRALTTEHDATIALYHPQNRPEARGGILLFHNEGSHADWATHMRPLRLSLSDQGWHTLSLQLPPPPQAEIPKRTLPVLQKVHLPSGTPEEGAAAPPAQTENAPAEPAETDTPAAAPDTPDSGPDSAEPMQPLPGYAERMQQLTDAALAELKGEDAERIILLGVGSGAVWAAAAAVRIQEDHPELGLVLIDAGQPSDPSAPALLSLLEKLKIPVVDAYQSLPETQLPFEAEAKQRLRRAQRAGLTHFHQRRLTNQAISWQGKEQWLTRQISGLLRQHVDKPIEATKLEREAALAGGDKQKGERAPGR